MECHAGSVSPYRVAGTVTTTPSSEAVGMAPEMDPTMIIIRLCVVFFVALKEQVNILRRGYMTLKSRSVLINSDRICRFLFVLSI